MANTVAKSFDEFKATIQLDDSHWKTVKSRKESVHEHLSKYFPSSSDLPLSRSKLIGSAERNTIIRPLNDLDIMAVFDNKNGIFEKYRYDSFAFITRIRNALDKYRVEVVGTRGQAVRLFYKVPPHADIAPVFEWTNGGYALPNGKGGWLTTNPDVHASYMAKRNSELSSNLKPLVRVLKRWNQVHGRRLNSFHLEVIAAHPFSNIGSSSREALKMFFENAHSFLSVSDPAGHSGDLSTYLTTLGRSQVLASFRTAYERSVRANQAEAAGRTEEAINLWRIVLGGDFPAYG